MYNYGTSIEITGGILYCKWTTAEKSQICKREHRRGVQPGNQLKTDLEGSWQCVCTLSILCSYKMDFLTMDKAEIEISRTATNRSGVERKLMISTPLSTVQCSPSLQRIFQYPCKQSLLLINCQSMSTALFLKYSAGLNLHQSS